MKKSKQNIPVVKGLVKYENDPILLKKEVEKQANYAKFNNQDHLLIGVPKEGLTLSCKLEDGRRVTFAFNKQVNREGEIIGAANSVDICLHDSPELPASEHRSEGCNKQQWALLNGGGTAFRTKGDEESACTLGVLLLNPKYYV